MYIINVSTSSYNAEAELENDSTEIAAEAGLVGAINADFCGLTWGVPKLD